MIKIIAAANLNSSLLHSALTSCAFIYAKHEMYLNNGCEMRRQLFWVMMPASREKSRNELGL